MPSCVAVFVFAVLMMPPLDLLDSKYGTCPTNGLRAVHAVRTPEERSSQVDFLLLLITPTSEPSCLIGECPESIFNSISPTFVGYGRVSQLEQYPSHKSIYLHSIIHNELNDIILIRGRGHDIVIDLFQFVAQERRLHQQPFRF